MEILLNEVNLKIPPLITIEVPDVTFAKQVRSVLLKRKSSQLTILQNELANNAALLSRLMARRKNSFHNMMGFKVVCKLNSALGRLLKLDIEQVLNNFYEMLPDSLHNNDVPSKNAFDHVLLRIMSIHKIYERISYCCIESADYFSKLLNNNFFIETITLFLAVIAKVWDLVNQIGNAYCKLYKTLLHLRKCFPEMESHHSFKNIDFPKELGQFSISHPTVEKGSNTDGSNAITVNKKNSGPTSIPIMSVLPKLQKVEDLGMAINRDSMKPVIDLSRVHSVEDIRQFFKDEDKNRGKSIHSCATKYILKHEWLAIQKLVERKIIANDHKKALTVFRKFITSKT